MKESFLPDSNFAAENMVLEFLRMPCGRIGTSPLLWDANQMIEKIGDNTQEYSPVGCWRVRDGRTLDEAAKQQSMALHYASAASGQIVRRPIERPEGRLEDMGNQKVEQVIQSRTWRNDPIHLKNRAVCVIGNLIHHIWQDFWNPSGLTVCPRCKTKIVFCRARRIGYCWHAESDLCRVRPTTPRERRPFRYREATPNLGFEQVIQPLVVLDR